MRGQNLSPLVLALSRTVLMFTHVSRRSAHYWAEAVRQRVWACEMAKATRDEDEERCAASGSRRSSDSAQLSMHADLSHVLRLAASPRLIPVT